MNKALFLPIILPLLTIPVFGMNTIVQDNDHNFNSGTLSQVQVRNQDAPAQLELQFAVQPVNTVNQPGIRRWQGAAYDQSQNRVLLFGGLGNVALNDTWRFDPGNETWSIVPLETRPPARYGHAQAASGDGKVFVFGGTDSTNIYNDTWMYRFADNSWQEVATSTAPSKRRFAAVAVSTGTKKIVLFGGRNESNALLNDTWVYDIALNSWTVKDPASAPAPRIGAAMTYNSANGKYYLFGGNDGSRKQDLWAYDENADAWTQIIPDGGVPPSLREGAGMYYDPEFGRVVVFGGIDISDICDDQVYYYYPLTNRWYKGTPVYGPVPRSDYSLLYLPPYRKAFIFGGVDQLLQKLNDTAYYVYRGTGSYTSTVLPVDYPETSLQWRKLSLTGTEPAATDIRFQVASSDDGSTWLPFSGPAGNPAAYYEGASEYDLWAGHNNRRYIKYRVELNSTQPPATPVIDKVVLSYNFAPRTPVPVNPLNGGSTSYATPVFTWSSTTDPDNSSVFNDTVTYHVQVDSWTGFSSADVNVTAISSATGSTTVYHSTTSLAHGTWYWRVRAYDGYAYGTWSSPFTLYVDTIAPQAVTDLAAEIGTLNGQAELSWTTPADTTPAPSVGPLTYYIRFATYSPITPAVYDGLAATERTGTLALTPGARATVNVNGLDDGTTCYFALKLADSAGNLSEIATAAAAVFTNAPPSVTVLSPLGGETWSGKQEIRWASSDPNPGDTLTFAITSSHDNGGNYDIAVVTGLPHGTTWYVWDTRGVCNGESHRIRITATDARGLYYSTETAGTFAISNPNEAPSVIVNAPYEGQAVSGTVVLGWRAADTNGADTHTFTVAVSSTGGETFFWQTVTPATYYALNTAALGNGPSYLLKVTAVDSGTPPLSGEASVLFRVDNQNLPPNAFSLLRPADGSSRSPIGLEFEWEDNGDPNPEDTLTYTLLFSTNADLSAPRTITGIRSARYRVNSLEFEAEKDYYWKVTARDPLGLERECSQTYWAVVLSRFKADSGDGKVCLEAMDGMPATGFLTVERVANTGFRSLRAADEETLANRQVRLLGESAYRVRVRDITETDIPAPDLSLRVNMYYPDANGDGYYDGMEVPEENLRCAVLDDEAGRWKLAPSLPVIDRSGKRLTTTLRSTGIISLMGALAPLRKVSSVVNYPNPFAAGREETRIKYVLTEDRAVTVSIYALTGDLVWKRVFNAGEEGGKGQPSGYCNEIRWNGWNDNGMIVADGMYILEIKAGQDREIRRIGVVK